MKLLNYLILLLVLTLSLESRSQTDTLFIHIRGEYKKGEVYNITYKDKSLGVFGHDANYIHCMIIIDSNDVSPFSFLNISLLKANRITSVFMPLKVLFIYDPNNKHIHIYHIRDRNNKGKFLVFNLPFRHTILYDYI